jgi:hypothetical protein
MPANPSRYNRSDPMREIDLLLLEELMMRRNCETSRSAVAVQTACLTLVGLFFFTAFLYALTHPEPVGAVLSNQSSHTEIGLTSAYSGIPQP